MVHFVVQCVATLGFFYVLIAALVGGGLLLTRTARTSVGVDRVFSLIPMIGKLRRNLALSRFCASYEMQLSAGVNVMDSVRAAGEASQSARVRAEVARMVPEMMAGESIGTLVVGRAVFPAAFQRSVRTGETTGTLDADLRRWAEYYQKAAIDSLEAAGAWLSRIVTLGILLYLGYKIVTTYAMVIRTRRTSNSTTWAGDNPSHVEEALRSHKLRRIVAYGSDPPSEVYILNATSPRTYVIH